MSQQSTDRLTELLSTALGTDIGALLDDHRVSEVRLNSDGSLWAHKLGIGKIKEKAFIAPENAKRAIQTVAFSVGEVCNEENPSISAELPGSGQRFQGVIPPVVKSPVIAIRKKAVRIFTLLDMETQGVLPKGARVLLEQSVLNKKNILVVGGTDSGKTTFTNALLQIVSKTKDRIVIIEDTQELQCDAEDVEYLRTRDGVCSLRDLVRTTMRLSPDRIVIGEVRSAEALDLLKAWNTGHSGGVSTVHASSAKKGLSRIEQLVSEANVSPSREMIAEAINIIVYMEKVGKKRIVKEITEVKGVKEGVYDCEQLY